jgi:hypothetical protein
MKLFESLSEKNFELFAIRNYYNPICVDEDEFYDDLNRFKYIKRLITRYKESDSPAVNLLLNHIVIVINVFGVSAAIKMLEYKINKEDWNIIKPFLIYLKVIDNTKYMGTPMDPLIVEGLRKL